MGKWSLTRGRSKGRGLTPFFFSGGPKNAGQREKKKKGLEGSREAREKISLCMHERRRMREGSEEAKPCLVGQCIEGVKQERGGHAQALPEKGRVGCSSGMGKASRREGRQVAKEEK